MKKILLSIFVLAIVGLSTNVQAQCTVKNLAIRTIDIDPETCEVEFEVSFEQEINSGNKFAYIHLWLDDEYHTPSSAWPTTGNKIIYSGPSYAPKATELQNAIATIAIYFNGTLDPQIGTIYYPDPTVNPLVTGLTIEKTIVDANTERETISGIKITLDNCAGVIGVKGDIWASQAQNGVNVHCATQDLFFALNDPQIIAAFKVCNPRSLTFGIKNNGTSSIELMYKIYKDDGDGFFEPGVGPGLDGDPITISTVETLAPGAIRSEQNFLFPGHDVVGENSDYWLQAIDINAEYTPIAFMSNDEAGCSPLPVKIKSFTASRKQTNVELKWTTTLEQNNSGFELQRQSGTGGWQKIAFVNSKATDGNSVSDLHYAYTDINDSRGVSQYRLMQIDLDDNAKYSDIRSVQGIGQEARTIISPNPSANGRVNVTFQSASAKRDLQLTDMHGRMLKQWNAYGDNSLQITDLTPGIYQLRIIDRETGTQTVEKIMVVNR